MEAVPPEPISAESISTKTVPAKCVGLMKRTATETAGLEAWAGETSSRRRPAEGMASIHVATETTASSKTPAVSAWRAVATTTHLRRSGH